MVLEEVFFGGVGQEKGGIVERCGKVGCYSGVSSLGGTWVRGDAEVASGRCKTGEDGRHGVRRGEEGEESDLGVQRREVCRRAIYTHAKQGPHIKDQ